MQISTVSGDIVSVNELQGAYKLHYYNTVFTAFTMKNDIYFETQRLKRVWQVVGVENSAIFDKILSNGGEFCLGIKQLHIIRMLQYFLTKPFRWCMIIHHVLRQVLFLLTTKFQFWIHGAYRGPYQKEILLIRMDALGDFLIATNLLKDVSEEYHKRGYRVVLVHSKSSSSIVEYLPWFDETICVPNEGESTKSELRKSWLKIAQRRSEIAVRCSTIFASPEDSLHLLACSGAKFRYALIPDIYSDFNSDGMDVPVAPPEGLNWRGRMMFRLFKKRDYIRFLDSCKHKAVFPFINCRIPIGHIDSVFDQEAELATALLDRKAVATPMVPDYFPTCDNPVSHKSYYVVIPGGSHLKKTWPTAKFAEIIRWIHDMSPELAVVFCGVKNEFSLVDSILQELPNDIPIENLVGKTTLPMLNAVVNHARFVLSNDTGTCHLAAMNRIPTVTLLGGGHYGVYFPAKVYKSVICVTVPKNKQGCFRCNCFCHKLCDGKYPCVAEISVEDVKQAVSQFLPVADDELL